MLKSGKMDFSRKHDPVSFGSVNEFEFRKETEEEIMTALRDENVNVVGLFGLGGVGKTAMVEKIINRVGIDNLYDQALMVVAGKRVDCFKIQSEIAQKLNLILGMETLSARADRIRSRLTGTMRILIVIDDLRESLELLDLGIPKNVSKRCKVIVISRSRHVLDAMEVQKICEMETLNEREAWVLFRKNAGDCVDDLNLHSVAKEVAKECKGLPIALVTVGTTLKDQKRKLTWEDALLQLRSGNPADVPAVLADVYRPLELCYDYLDAKHARSIMLLCSMFPEECDIPVEYLSRYAFGLSMFEGTTSLNHTRSQVHSLVDMLKSRFILLNGCSEHHVRMHQVVRDLANFIAAREHCVLIDVDCGSVDCASESTCKHCIWTSMTLKDEAQLPKALHFPNLRLLLMQQKHRQDVDLVESWYDVFDERKESGHEFFDGTKESWYDFFDGMKELRVLAADGIQIGDVPQSTQLRESLRTLQLYNCGFATISGVGEMANLETLSCRECNHLGALPEEIGQLKHLKLLELYNCESLKIIPPGVISRLVLLEELKMQDSFRGWEAKEKGKQRKNAALTELESLSNLTCLEIEVGDASLASMDISLSPKIVKFNINFSPNQRTEYKNSYDSVVVLRFPRPKPVTLGKWLHRFIRRPEMLVLYGNVPDILDFVELSYLKKLKISHVSNVKTMINPTSIVFPQLESLELEGILHLENICTGPISAASNSLRNLTDVRLVDLPCLRNLLSVSTSSSQIEHLTIERCDAMEEVFLVEMLNKETSCFVFSKLRKLELRCLPNLKAFCKGVQSIDFPQLNVMEVAGLGNLGSLVSLENDLGLTLHDDDSLHIFCNQEAKFGSLRKLTISGIYEKSNAWCRQIPLSFFSQLEWLRIDHLANIKILFPSSVAEHLISLRTLVIGDCWEMVKVIADGDEKVHDQECVLFPSLELLVLQYQPELEIFCEWKCCIVLPSLKRVTVNQCPRMKSLTLRPLSTPELEEVLTEYRLIKMKEMNVGNHVLQNEEREDKVKRRIRELFHL